MVDNDYINYTRVVSSEELKKDWNIDIDNMDDNDIILVSIPERDMYLIRTY